MEARRKGVLSYLFTDGPGGLLRSSIRRAVGEELGDLVWGGGVCTLCLLVHLEEHLLLALFLVQIFFQSLGQRADGTQSHHLGHKSPLPLDHQGGLLWKFPPHIPPPPAPGFSAQVTWSSLFPTASTMQELPVGQELCFGEMPV